MLGTITWLLIGICLFFLSVTCYCATVSTGNDEAMFDEDNCLLEKFVGCVLWAIFGGLWIWWFSAIIN